MKKFTSFLLVVMLLALDWAALHDILKDNEPSLVVEWTVLALSSIFFASLAIRFFCSFGKHHADDAPS